MFRYVNYEKSVFPVEDHILPKTAVSVDLIVFWVALKITLCTYKS